jgi:hypothetical protein
VTKIGETDAKETEIEKEIETKKQPLGQGKTKEDREVRLQ